MKIEAEQVLCRFQLSNFVKHGWMPLYEWLVDTARREGLHGATVFKGFHGMKSDGTILEEHVWALMQELPVIVEVIEEPARIEALLAIVEPALHDTRVTLERAHVLMYRRGPTQSREAMTARNIITTSHESAAAGVRTMNIPDIGVLLRIFIGESDKDPDTHEPLYKAIVRRAREAHLAGATVLKSPLGFGRHSRVHSASIVDLSVDLPIVIEIVDAEEKIDAFLPVVDSMVTEGLVTLEAVRILRYVSPDTR